MKKGLLHDSVRTRIVRPLGTCGCKTPPLALKPGTRNSKSQDNSVIAAARCSQCDTRSAPDYRDSVFEGERNRQGLVGYMLALLCYVEGYSVIHRTVIGLGPKQLQTYFKLDAASRNPSGRETRKRHNQQLVTFREGKFLYILAKSALGLIDVYNFPDQKIIDAENVVQFQKRLQERLICEAENRMPGWKDTYSPRCEFHAHPLRCGMTICDAIGPEVESPRNEMRSCVDSLLRFGS